MTAWHPLQRLHTLDEAPDGGSAGYTGITRWVIPYADLLTLLLGFFIILFAVIKTENISLHQEKTAAQQALDTARKKEAVANQAIEQLSSMMHLDNADVGKLMESLSQKMATAAPAPTEASMKQLQETLIQQLNLSGQQVTVSQDARGLVISLQERIFFEPGKATLSTASQHTLDKLANVLMPLNHPIRVEGHTDDTPIQTAFYPSNWELSTARATTIVRNLADKHHFPPKRLSAAGYGEFYPLADNSTIEGKQKNRRVDIVVLNPLTELSPEASSESITPSVKE